MMVNKKLKPGKEDDDDDDLDEDGKKKKKGKGQKGKGDLKVSGKRSNNIVIHHNFGLRLFLWMS